MLTPANLNGSCLVNIKPPSLLALVWRWLLAPSSLHFPPTCPPISSHPSAWPRQFLLPFDSSHLLGSLIVSDPLISISSPSKAAMFRRRWSGLPADPVFNSNFQDLGQVSSIYATWITLTCPSVANWFSPEVTLSTTATRYAPRMTPTTTSSFSYRETSVGMSASALPCTVGTFHTSSVISTCVARVPSNMSSREKPPSVTSSPRVFAMRRVWRS